MEEIHSVVVALDPNSALNWIGFQSASIKDLGHIGNDINESVLFLF